MSILNQIITTGKSILQDTTESLHEFGDRIFKGDEEESANEFSRTTQMAAAELLGMPQEPIEGFENDDPIDGKTTIVTMPFSSPHTSKEYVEKYTVDTKGKVIGQRFWMDGTPYGEAQEYDSIDVEDAGALLFLTGEDMGAVYQPGSATSPYVTCEESTAAGKTPEAVAAPPDSDRTGKELKQPAVQALLGEDWQGPAEIKAVNIDDTDGKVTLVVKTPEDLDARPENQRLFYTYTVDTNGDVVKQEHLADGSPNGDPEIFNIGVKNAGHILFLSDENMDTVYHPMSASSPNCTVADIE